MGLKLETTVGTAICQDTILCSLKVIKNLVLKILAILRISKLLKYSSKGRAKYLKIKEELAPSDPGFCMLRPEVKSSR